MHDSANKDTNGMVMGHEDNDERETGTIRARKNIPVPHTQE